VDEGFSTHRTDLAFGKETRHRDIAAASAHLIRIMVCAAVETLTAAEARQKDCARKTVADLRQRSLKLLARRGRISKLELHDLLLVEHRSDQKGPRRLVLANEVPHEEIPLTERPLTVPYTQTQQERLMRGPLITLAKALDDFIGDLQRGPSIKLEQNIFSRSRHEHRETNWAASLRNDGLEHDIARERDAYSTTAVHIAANIQGILTGSPAPACQTSDRGRTGKGGFEPTPTRAIPQHRDERGSRLLPARRLR